MLNANDETANNRHDCREEGKERLDRSCRSGVRGRAKKERQALRAAADRLARRKEGASRVLQCWWRCARARRELERLKGLLREDRERRDAAAGRIQRVARLSRCR